MINRRAFFEIFFYNRENPTRELLETAESVWRAYMKKYGLGLDASNSGEPTYEEVKEITYLANYAIEMMAAKEAAAAAPAPSVLPEEPEEIYEEPAAEAEVPVQAPVPEPAEEPEEELPVQAPAEEPEAVAQERPAEPEEDPVEEPEEEPEEEILQPTPVVIEKVRSPRKPVRAEADGSDTDLWVEQLTHWCESKGFQCIRSMDDGDCYLHVYLPYKKEVLPVGKWCLKARTNGADLAAEISKLYAYCTGYADCFAQLTR